MLEFNNALIIAAVYLAVMLTSGIIVKFFLCNIHKDMPELKMDTAEHRSEGKLGAVIGKCENFLTLTFIIANAYTALALVFTAKSIVRLDSIKKSPEYYLGGTLINFSYSVFWGFLLMLFLKATG